MNHRGNTGGFLGYDRGTSWVPQWYDRGIPSKIAIDSVYPLYTRTVLDYLYRILGSTILITQYDLLSYK